MSPTSQDSVPVGTTKKFSLLPHIVARHLLDTGSVLYLVAPNSLQSLQLSFPAAVQPLQATLQGVQVLTLSQ